MNLVFPVHFRAELALGAPSASPALGMAHFDAPWHPSASPALGMAHFDAPWHPMALNLDTGSAERQLGPSRSTHRHHP